MTKQLTQIGNSLGFIIEKPILDLLNLDAETKFEVTTDGRAITFRPVSGQQRRASELLRLADDLMDGHDETFRKLAK